MLNKKCFIFVVSLVLFIFSLVAVLSFLENRAVAESNIPSNIKFIEQNSNIRVYEYYDSVSGKRFLLFQTLGGNHTSAVVAE